MTKAVRAPRHDLYRQKWDIEVPASLTQSLTEPGRPATHLEYVKAWDYYLGRIEPDPVRWLRLNNFYLNCIRAVDLQIKSVLDELDDLALTDRTIVVFTSDHGELGGAHGGMRGKGPTPYEECIHLPFVIAHPDVPGRQDCHALTSHMDIAPTLASLAGATPDQLCESAGRELPGKDISKVLSSPAVAKADELREGALFAYSGLAMVDSDPLLHTLELIQQGTPFAEAMAHGGKPNLMKRGSLRTVVDSRYKLTRYFSPLQHNTPASTEELYRYNDVELFDLLDDRGEMRNLAVEPEANADLLMTMNAKLNALIADEIGQDNGHELPDMEGISWEVRPTGDAIVMDSPNRSCRFDGDRGSKTCCQRTPGT